METKTVPPRSEAKFKPFIPDERLVAEFSPKAIILGAIFGLIFGAATVYLALRAGLTVSASIPIAVLAIAVFKRFGKSTILENNIVQTIGSAGESLEQAVIAGNHAAARNVRFRGASGLANHLRGELVLP